MLTNLSPSLISLNSSLLILALALRFSSFLKKPSLSSLSLISSISTLSWVSRSLRRKSSWNSSDVVISLVINSVHEAMILVVIISTQSLCCFDSSPTMSSIICSKSPLLLPCLDYYWILEFTWLFSLGFLLLIFSNLDYRSSCWLFSAASLFCFALSIFP